jgi:hypothetical protein
MRQQKKKAEAGGQERIGITNAADARTQGSRGNMRWHMRRRKVMSALGLALLLDMPAGTAGEIDVGALFDQAETAGRLGIARKTKLVDGRSARPCEVIVTVIKREGKETQSPPAEAGDVVIRNRCPPLATRNISSRRPSSRPATTGPGGRDESGWQPYRPNGIEMRFFVVAETEGTFTFTAPCS